MGPLDRPAIDRALIEIASSLERETSRETLNDWLDTLEYIYDALGEEEQHMCSQLIEQVSGKLTHT